MYTIIIDSKESGFLSKDDNINETVENLIKRELSLDNTVIVLRTEHELTSFLKRTNCTTNNISHTRFYDTSKLTSIIRNIGVVGVDNNEIVSITLLALHRAMVIPLKYYSDIDIKIRAYSIKNNMYMFTMKNEFGEFYYMNGIWFKLDDHTEQFMLKLEVPLDIFYQMTHKGDNINEQTYIDYLRTFLDFNPSDSFQTNLPELICHILNEPFESYKDAQDIVLSVMLSEDEKGV